MIRKKERGEGFSLILKRECKRRFSKILFRSRSGWDLAGYRGLFCPLNKLSCDRGDWGVYMYKGFKSSGRGGGGSS